MKNCVLYLALLASLTFAMPREPDFDVSQNFAEQFEANVKKSDEAREKLREDHLKQSGDSFGSFFGDAFGQLGSIVNKTFEQVNKTQEQKNGKASKDIGKVYKDMHANLRSVLNISRELRTKVSNTTTNKTAESPFELEEQAIKITLANTGNGVDGVQASILQITTVFATAFLLKHLVA